MYSILLHIIPSTAVEHILKPKDTLGILWNKFQAQRCKLSLECLRDMFSRQEYDAYMLAKANIFNIHSTGHV